MKLKEMIKDLKKLNEINTKYNLSNFRYKIELSERRGACKPITIDNEKDLKVIENTYIERVADKMINGEWSKDYDNYYYMDYEDEYNKVTYTLSIQVY